MNREIKREWIEALESGRYKQGIGYLEDDGKFCCLGVLCKTLRISTRDNRRIGSDGINSDATLEYLSDAVLDRVGLTHEQQEDLSVLNDNGDDFRDIAEYIRKNL